MVQAHGSHRCVTGVVEVIRMPIWLTYWLECEPPEDFTHLTSGPEVAPKAPVHDRGDTLLAPRHLSVGASSMTATGRSYKAALPEGICRSTSTQLPSELAYPVKRPVDVR